MPSAVQVAAGTLDASTKIYAVRVDAVHADAYRVLGGLGAETKPGEGGIEGALARLGVSPAFEPRVSVTCRARFGPRRRRRRSHRSRSGGQAAQEKEASEENGGTEPEQHQQSRV